MTTTLKSKAYWIPVFLVAMPVLLWVFLDKLNSLDDFRIGLVFFLCFLILILSLSSNYKQYSIDKQKLTVQDLITRKTTIIPLQDIVNYQILDKKAGNALYQNLIIKTQQKEYILNGVYVNGMRELHNELEENMKK
ncbi:hypothetical protein AD998_11370 [bacterium 336/3]|nr:hypothetical protein AD998_11370 [bacterium 336/3]